MTAAFVSKQLANITTAEVQLFLNKRDHPFCKTLQAITRHADIQATMNRYVHQ